MTNSNSLDVTLRPLSKKMPPRKGLKNLSMMASENPSACIASHQTPAQIATVGTISAPQKESSLH